MPGTFSWQDETIIPWGGDNGSVIYWVIFTPDEEAAKLYAPCEIEVSVQTQIGVNVEFTADSRDYVKDSTEATGTYRLVDADRGIVYEELQLTGGQMKFSQWAPGKELQVVFAGYQLENDEDGLYILLNESAKSEAEIRWIQPVLETAPTVNGTVTVGTALRDVEVTGGRAVYKVAANAYQEAAGTWTWDAPGYTLSDSDEGEQEFTLTFVPEDKVGFRSITGIKVKLTVTKREVEIPLIAGLTYDGNWQKPVVNETKDYKVTENNGGISAGTYTVTLQLKYPYMVWKESGLATDGSQATVSSENPAVAVVSYQIKKADLTVSADPAGNDIQVQKLGYGQELTEGEKETRTVNGKVVDFRLSAQDMISGVVVSYERNGSSIPVTGKWKWMLTDETGEPYSQPLPVDTWYIKAEFIPEENQRGNLNPVSYRFPVKVEKAVPDASSCAFETINVIGLGALNVPLTLCKLDQPQPVNPNNGEKVNGVWNWEDPEMILNGRKYNVIFTPTDSKNYGTVNSSAEVNAANTQMSTVEVQYSSEEAVASIKRQVVGIWGTTRKYSFLIDVSTPAGTNAGNMTFSEVQIVMGNETASCRVDASGNYVYTISWTYDSDVSQFFKDCGDCNGAGFDSTTNDCLHDTNDRYAVSGGG